MLLVPFYFFKHIKYSHFIFSFPKIPIYSVFVDLILCFMITGSLVVYFLCFVMCVSIFIVSSCFLKVYFLRSELNFFFFFYYPESLFLFCKGPRDTINQTKNFKTKNKKTFLFMTLFQTYRAVIVILQQILLYL